MEIVASILRKNTLRDEIREESIERDLDMDLVREWIRKHEKREEIELQQKAFASMYQFAME